MRNSDRYILRFRGAGPKPAADVQRICELSQAKVVDDSSRMLLVEAPAARLQAALADMPEWAMSPVRSIPLPDTRVKVLQPVRSAAKAPAKRATAKRAAARRTAKN